MELDFTKRYIVCDWNFQRVHGQKRLRTPVLNNYIVPWQYALSFIPQIIHKNKKSEKLMGLKQMMKTIYNQNMILILRDLWKCTALSVL